MSEEKDSLQQEGITKGITRRALLKFGGLAALSAGAGRLAAEIPSGKESRINSPVRAISELTYEDLDNPESPKFQGLVFSSAIAYEATANGIMPSQTPRFHRKEQDFVEAVKATGDTDYGSKEGAIAFGWTHYGSGEININLEGIGRFSRRVTRYPGIKLVDVLFHEWGEALPKARNKGEFLNKDSEFFSAEENGHHEAWERYWGGRVYSRTANGFRGFDHVWLQLCAQRQMMEVLKGKPELLSSAVNILPNFLGFEGVRRLSSVAERAGLRTADIISFRLSSDFEEMMRRMGSIFKDSALGELSDIQKGGRSSAAVMEDRDFLIGKRVAILIETKSWDALDQMLTQLK
jgi:hypothetical protein